MTRIDLATLEREVTSLFEAYPELAEDEDLRAGMLEGSTDVMDVLARLVAQMLDAKMMSAAIATRATAIMARQARYDRREEATRKLVFKLMGIAGLRKCELPEATLSVRAGSQRAIITDESELPFEYFRVTKTPDKTAIKDALKAGTFIPGATLTNGEDTLSVRTA